jgi:hypothetical protein
MLKLKNYKEIKMTVKVIKTNGEIEEYPNAHIEWEWDESEKGTDSGWRVHSMDKNCTTVSAFIYPRDCEKIEITHEESDMVFEPPKAKPLSKGALHIMTERMRQIEKEGFTAEHDDLENNYNQLVRAAACYALPQKIREDKSFSGYPYPSMFEMLWPPNWDKKHWKSSPYDRIRELEKAGALIAAEIDRLLRVKE